MTLDNDVLRKQWSRQGIYQYNGIVNRKHSWKSEDQAIWFAPKRMDWAIGPLRSIGTSLRAISSVVDKDIGLFDVPNNKWRYYAGRTGASKWKDIESGDINITCIGNKDKMLQHPYA